MCCCMISKIIHSDFVDVFVLCNLINIFFRKTLNEWWYIQFDPACVKTESERWIRTFDFSLNTVIIGPPISELRAIIFCWGDIKCHTLHHHISSHLTERKTANFFFNCPTSNQRADLWIRMNFPQGAVIVNQAWIYVRYYIKTLRTVSDNVLSLPREVGHFIQLYLLGNLHIWSCIGLDILKVELNGWVCVVTAGFGYLCIRIEQSNCPAVSTILGPIRCIRMHDAVYRFFWSVTLFGVFKYSEKPTAAVEIIGWHIPDIATERPPVNLQISVKVIHSPKQILHIPDAQVWFLWPVLLRLIPTSSILSEFICGLFKIINLSSLFWEFFDTFIASESCQQTHSFLQIIYIS